LLISNFKFLISSFYIHIPFCEKKCAYCNFSSIAGHSDLHLPYFNALKREIERFLSTSQLPSFPTSIYFGGGTPSSVKTDYLIKILNLFKKRCESGKACPAIGGVKKWEGERNFQPEITVECNPHSLSIEFTEKLLEAGVNRFSLGVQSLNNYELEKLGRLHDAELARKAFILLRSAGCKNISVDLMFGIPGQSKKSWLKTLSEVGEKWRPEHISFYSLSIEPGTPFAKWRDTKNWNWPDNDETMDWYWLGNKLLSENGYNRYEISNFSMPGLESKHNSVYWNFKGSYIGFGSGAHSFYAFPGKKKRRFRNLKSLEKYIERVETENKFRTFSRELTKREKAGEEIFLGLRLSKGIKITENHLGFFDDIIKQQIKDGLIKYVDKEKIALTNRGIEIANVVMSEYV